MSRVRNQKIWRLAACLLAVLCMHGTASASPQYRAKLKVAGYSLYSSLENFPLLVRLSESRISGFQYADCAANGADISFTLPDGTLLHHEVDTWNTSGDSLVWVSLPTFRNGSTLYVRWKDSAPPTIDPTLVWSRANYVGVWHLNEASGDAVDSSGNGYAGTLCGSQSAKCVTCESALGRGRQMGSSGTGANSIYFKFATVPQATMAATFSISFWAKVTTNSGDYWFANKNATTDNGFSACGNGFYNTAEFNIAGDGSSTTKCLTRTSSLVTGTWSPFEFFWNGSSVNIRCGTSGGGRTTTMVPAQDGFAIGSTMNGSLQAFRGQMDEIRLRTVVPSDAWRTADEEQGKKSEFVVADSAAEEVGECIFVSSVGTEFATGGIPAYGQHLASVGTSYTLTAPASVPYQDGTVTATCLGWTLFRISDGVVVRTSEEPAAGENTTTCIVDYTEPVELRWQWTTTIGDGPITYYISRSGDDTDGLSWSTAFRHPQTALDAVAGTAERPATVLVEDGRYVEQTVGHVHAVLNITNGYVAIKSVNGPTTTILDGTINKTSDSCYAYRAVAIASGLENVLVSGFAVKNGYKQSDSVSSWYSATSIAASSGILSNMQVVVYNRNRCNPVYLTGSAQLLDSDITTESTTVDNGWPNQYDNRLVSINGSAVVDRCKIHDVVPFARTIISMAHYCVQPVGLCSANAVLRNTLVEGCTVGADGCTMTAGGGAVYASAGTIENCTISGNTCYSGVGGLYLAGSVVCRNNIIWGNTTSGGSNNDIAIASSATPSVTYTCSSDVTTGVDENVNGDPKLNDDFTLPIDSLVAGAGDKTLDWLTGAVDLARNPRLWTDGTVSMGAYEPQGRSKALLGDFALTNAVDYGNAPFAVGFKATVKGATASATYAWDFGDGTVSSEVEPTHTYSDPGLYTVSLTVTDTEVDPLVVTKPGFVTVVGETCYVKAGNTGVKPYDTWEKAAGEVEDALKLRPANIVVTNGTYVLSAVNGLILDWPVTVRSIEGAANTVLDTGARGIVGSDMSVKRLLTMSDKGATISGFTFDYGYNQVLVTAGGRVENCHLHHYQGTHHALPVYASGTAFANCIFDFSHYCRDDANAKAYGSLNAITLENGSSADGCVVSNFLANCAMDTQLTVGAIRTTGTNVIVRNCLVIGNEWSTTSVATLGHGILVSGNTNEVSNCTVAGNIRSSGGETDGMGIRVTSVGATVANNLVWNNRIAGEANDSVSASSTATFALKTSNLVGTDPLFLDDGAGYRIDRTSPCFDGGALLPWCRHRKMATDIDGNERKCGSVDIGCYEVGYHPGLLLFVK